MIKFLDGPAADVVLALRRAPVLLRVVRGPRGKWDALDQLDDTPEPNETIFVYRVVGTPTWVHFCCRGKGKRESGVYWSGEYRLLDFQPTDEQMRTNEAWAAWCDSVKDRVLKGEGATA